MQSYATPDPFAGEVLIVSPLAKYRQQQSDWLRQDELKRQMLGVGNPAYARTAHYFWNAHHTGDDRIYHFYPLPMEGRQMVSWYNSLTKSEQIVAGAVLADWFEENFDTLMTGAKGPTDPAKRLMELISYLRSRLVGV